MKNSNFNDNEQLDNSEFETELEAEVSDNLKTSKSYKEKYKYQYKYEMAHEIIGKTYKLDKTLVENFKYACKKEGTSQSKKLTELMLNYINNIKDENQL